MGPDGIERPIAFSSRTLSKAERNYAQIEKEALSIIFGVRKFHQFLYGHHFVLVTDHKPLTAIFGPTASIPPLAAARMHRWALYLSAYSYSLEYHSTHLHSNADALSRLPLELREEEKQEGRDVSSRFNLVQMASVPLTHLELKAATQKDPLLAKVLEFTRNGWPKEIPEELKVFFRRSGELTVEAGCLLLGNRVVIPGSYHQKLLAELHSGHPGICRMKALARGYIWWPGIDQRIEEVAKSCQLCAEIKTTPSVAPLHPWLWPEQPWRRIHIDFAGPLYDKMYMLVVDAHSKWPEIWEMKSTSATRTVEVLKHLFSLYGLPEQVVTDNGPQFVSSEFASFLSSRGIKHFRSAPYHPATNGAVERMVKTFKQAMKIGKREREPALETLERFLFMYRSTPHAVTGVTPAELFLKRPLRTRLDLLKPDVGQTVNRSQARQKYYHDRRAGAGKIFEVGQSVLARDYRSGKPQWLRGYVSQVLGSHSYLISMSDGSRARRHADQLKGCFNSKSVVGEAEPAVVSEDQDVDVDIDCSQDSVVQNPVVTSFSSSEGAALSPPDSSTRDVPSTTQAPSFSDRYPTRNRRPPERPGLRFLLRGKV